MNKIRNLALASAAVLTIAACGRVESNAAPDNGRAMEADGAADYDSLAGMAVADTRRSDADRADDERRKAREALAFFQVEPGMTVFEMEAGGGWYTELLSYAVGPDGAVIMQNPEGFRDFAGEEIDRRLAGDRLVNVRASYTNFDHLDAPDGSVDLVTWVQGPHELYFKPESGPLGDPKTSYAEIFRILKPGGVYAVIDHSAAEGAPDATGNELHRIDKAIVIDMAKKAGFAVDAESDFLANSDDARDLGVFDPAIRGHTDQFAIRFRKPR